MSSGYKFRKTREAIWPMTIKLAGMPKKRERVVQRSEEEES